MPKSTYGKNDKSKPAAVKKPSSSKMSSGKKHYGSQK